MPAPVNELRTPGHRRTDCVIVGKSPKINLQVFLREIALCFSLKKKKKTALANELTKSLLKVFWERNFAAAEIHLCQRKELSSVAPSLCFLTGRVELQQPFCHHETASPRVQSPCVQEGREDAEKGPGSWMTLLSQCPQMPALGLLVT